MLAVLDDTSLRNKSDKESSEIIRPFAILGITTMATSFESDHDYRRGYHIIQ